jgi:hypothetical protein
VRVPFDGIRARLVQEMSQDRQVVLLVVTMVWVFLRAQLAWTWVPLLGSAVTFAVGSALGRKVSPGPAPPT